MYFELNGDIWNLFQHVVGLKLDHQWLSSKFGRVQNSLIRGRKLDQFKINKASSKFTMNFELTHCSCKNSMFFKFEIRAFCLK